MDRHALHLLLLAGAALVACATSGSDAPPPPAIVPATQRGSRPEPIPEGRRHNPVRIAIHHAGVTWNAGDDPVQKLRNLQTWGQRDKDWPDVPYHFLIAPDGRVFAGRPLVYSSRRNADGAQRAMTPRRCARRRSPADIVWNPRASHRVGNDR